MMSAYQLFLIIPFRSTEQLDQTDSGISTVQRALTEQSAGRVGLDVLGIKGQTDARFADTRFEICVKCTEILAHRRGTTKIGS